MSKYEESKQNKISLGPVFALNPTYVKRISVVGPAEESAWIEVVLVANYTITSELETLTWCKEKAKAFRDANPAIECFITDGTGYGRLS
jgi:hypothetical protein